ncbi:restriction endonuclease subunit S [Bifidobacterium animalis]|uniref:restriction endonuclease subunit S n=1 Tax=Bifidobacterium animalis TaxID=28025 RepID=UPI00214A4F96|nr:restriction endonuclease subunit S [Bifidobacterium animalis]MCR1995033.1 restriction endonuclease subunit S [Bifidobacterium animalis subsp. animalis]
MSDLDVTLWKDFRIGDLFQIEKGTRLTKQHMIPGSIPFVGASAKNNGITAFIGNDSCLHPAGSITVSYNGSVGEAFYQNREFWASDDVNVLIPFQPISMNSMLFILPVLKSIGRRYGYNNKWRQATMLNDCIILPSTSQGEPDWEYMDSYMQRTMKSAVSVINELQDVELGQHSMDLSSWRSFLIQDLFVVTKGTRLTRANMIEGTTPFVGATLENNGITAYVGNTEHIHPGGVMTVAYNGQKAMGKAFWQPKPFWASDDVNVLYPKFELTREIALFLQPLFWEASKPFSYDAKWGKEAMERTPIMLPTDPQGEPDWQWMQQYIERALKDADRMVEACRQLL